MISFDHMESISFKIYVSTVPWAAWGTELRPDMIISRTQAPQTHFDKSPFISVIYGMTGVELAVLFPMH